MDRERERRQDLAALQQARKRNLADTNTHKSTKLGMKAVQLEEEFVRDFETGAPKMSFQRQEQKQKIAQAVHGLQQGKTYPQGFKK